MSSSKKWVRLSKSFLTIVTGIAVVSSCSKHLNDSPINDVILHEREHCADFLRLRWFMKDNFPKLNIRDTSSSLSKKDKRAINNDHDVFFRFLSLISGKPTSYNLEVDHYSLKNIKWIELPENVELAEWFERNQDKIPCEIFSEFYNIEKGIREGPQKRIDGVDEYMRESEEFFDSVYEKKERFEKKYSGFLSDDSIKKSP